ncbi:MAG: outer membrane beta-barrel protein [Alphaproteobacteria bacterium]
MLQKIRVLNKVCNRDRADGLICSLVAAVLLTVLVPGAACADTSPYALQQALATDQHFDLYTPKSSGLKIGSSYFSGLASGVTASDSFANFGNDQRMYAMLVDGRYDFNQETSSLSSPLRPYLMGSMGVATTSGGSNFDSQSGSTVPLFRLGGGIAYRLDERWDMSLDYKAGLASASPGDYLFTGRGQQQVDLQTLNIGMHYAF